MDNLNIPRFITFEGGEGCGKSTQSKMLYEYLLANNIKAIHTREIGGTKSAEFIREMVIHQELLPISELLLVMAARYEHIMKVITPALNEGMWVICDRYIDSTACYQGQAKETSLNKIYQLHKSLGLELMPFLTFFIDLHPEVAINRALVRGNINKFEEKSNLFHLKVYKNFKHVSEIFKKRIITIDAIGLDKQQLHQKIIKHLEHHLQS